MIAGDGRQVEAQSQLYASEFVKMTAAGLVVQDAAGVIVDCNEAAAATLGLTRDQMVGRASVDPRWAAVRENGSRFPVEEHPGMVTLRSGTPCNDVIMGVDNPG
ncbi:MAG: PAS domain S-box protein, partial [Actinomycetota bacterium]|nr:PAS domain S-box protein [Actinomycetota bacterium]